MGLGNAHGRPLACLERLGRSLCRDMAFAKCHFKVFPIVGVSMPESEI